MKQAKWYITLLLLMLAALVMSACAPASPPPAAPAEEKPTAQPPEKKVVLHVMDNWGLQSDAKGPPLHSIFEDFMKAYPNITIEEEIFSDTEIPPKVETAFLAGKEPDLVFQNWPQGTRDWPDGGVAIDVAGLMEQWGLTGQFKELALKQFTLDDGRIVAFPLEGFTWPTWYNMKILNEAGVEDVPKTIDELLTAAKKIRAAGYQPFVTGGSDWTGQALFNTINSSLMTAKEFGEVWANGGFSESENFVKSVELFVQLRDAGVFADNVEGLEFSSRNQMFFDGKAAMMHGGAWIFSECPEEIRQHVIVSGFPLPPDSPHAKPILETGFYGKGIFITRNGAKKLDAVEKFVKFFYQPEMIARFVEQAGMTSPLKETPVDESKLNPLFLQSLKWGDSITYVEVADPFVPSKAWEDLWKVTKKAYLPGTSAEEIVTDLEQAWELFK